MIWLHTLTALQSITSNYMSYIQLHVITCKYMHYMVLHDFTWFTWNYKKLHVSLLHTITCHYTGMSIHALHSLTFDYICYMFLHDVTCYLSNNIPLHPFHRMYQAPAVQAGVCRAPVPQVWATERDRSAQGIQVPVDSAGWTLEPGLR